jgi:hypothetical protein
MPADPSNLDPQQLWQRQPREHDPMTVADIHAQALKFERRVRFGNLTEYIACVFVVIAFGWVALEGQHMHENTLVRVGAALIVVGTFIVAWQLRARASLRAPLESADCFVDAYREALIRRRDALRSVGVWYLAPFAPGMAVMLLGYWFLKPRAGAPAAVVHVTTVMVALIVALTFLVVWLINQRGADRLQRQLDEL